MPRKPRQFELEKPIDITTCYTGHVHLPPGDLWRVRLILKQMTKRFSVRLLGSFYNEKRIRLRLYFDKNCGCTLSKVMQWFLTRLAKCVNGVLKIHGKVFYDRFASKINHLFLLRKYMLTKVYWLDEIFGKESQFCVSDPDNLSLDCRGIPLRS